ncbi:MAG: DUF2207 domain-containing protein [Aminivibrio sp.]
MRRAFSLSVLFVLAFSLILAAVPLSAKERITSFNVEAEIGSDASLTVTERIAVISEGREIKRGIIRSIPTDFTDTEGVKRRALLELLEATLDGRPTMIDTSRSGANLEFRLGNPDVLLPPGEHVFEIVYRTEGQLGFFAAHDELYWNVTGNDWTFEIEKASFRARLPEKAFGEGFSAIEFYTGRAGEKGKAAQVLPEGTVESTTPYFPGQGLTVAFSWPKGIIPPPDRPAPPVGGAALKILKFIHLAVAALLLLLMAAFWWFWGRDPAPQPVIPLFEPPRGVEAGFARYVRDMGTDDKAFTAMILGMAVKGALTIRESNMAEDASSLTGMMPSGAGKALKLLARFAGPTFRLQLDRTRLDDADLTAAERRVAEDLFGATRNEVHLSAADRPVIQAAFGNLERHFKTRGKPLLATNFGKWIIGVGLFEAYAIASFILMAMTGHMSAEPFIALLAGPFFLFPMAIPVPSGKGSFITRLILKIFVPGSFVLLALFLGFWSVIGNLDFSLWSLPAPFISVAILYVFRPLLRVRTERGARLNESIEGLHMYITAAEKHRLEMAPPEETPQVFEKLFPYAFALDAADTWANRFQHVLEKAGYSPSWYSGDLSTFATGAGVAAFSSALSGAVSSGTRSSGSGGGGSSGGGGGGGGGSGW